MYTCAAARGCHMVQVWWVTKFVMACKKKDSTRRTGFIQKRSQHFEGDAIEMVGPRVDFVAT